jgi:hypothetical protein
VNQYQYDYHPLKKTSGRDWFWFFMWMIGIPVILYVISLSMGNESDSDNINDIPYCYVDPVTQLPDC